MSTHAQRGGGRAARTLAVLFAAALLGVPLLMVTAVVSVVGKDRQAAAQACAAALDAAGPTDGGGLPAGLTPGARARFYEPLQLEPGRWYRTGATRFYNAPGDATAYGAIPDPAQRNLMAHPDTFAELSLAPRNPANYRTFTFADANALGRLPYMTALVVARGHRSIVVRKRDIGYGQGIDTTPDGERYRIDLWGPAADKLGVSKDEVRIALAPPAGAGDVLGDTSQDPATDPALNDPDAATMCTDASGVGPLPLTSGERARLLHSGLAAAPREAPAAVKQIIAAGNEIVGKPYRYGAGHGAPLSQILAAYDCSSSVAHLLYGARLIPVGYTPASGEMASSLGAPGYGQWVSVLANPSHVYAYVAGLRWDTHDAVPGESGNAGIGWHTGRRDDTAFTPRHPNGL